jgi:N-acylneuraminate cytidylyltransferase
MIAGRRVLGLVPARGGSKRAPRKNIREIAGKPLIFWTIEAALRSRYIDLLVVSSDDNEILRTVGDYRRIRRPDHLATDSASSEAVARHALLLLPDFDYVVLLQPTSPLRIAGDIDGAIALLDKTDYRSTVATVCADMLPLCYNGAVYCAKTAHIRAQGRFVDSGTLAYVMPVSRSLDIDTEADLQLADRHLKALLLHCRA